MALNEAKRVTLAHVASCVTRSRQTRTHAGQLAGTMVLATKSRAESWRSKRARQDVLEQGRTMDLQGRPSWRGIEGRASSLIWG